MGAHRVVGADTYSRFGGFWIDRRDSEEQLEARLGAGDLTPVVAERIGRLMRDGYVVIPGAVPAELTAALREEIERIWSDPPEGALVEVSRLGRATTLTPHPDLRVRSTKLLDIHGFSETARRAIAAPAVVELLSAVFEARPKAFQTLTFWRGSQQAIHKDTAYVRIDEEPMQFAATWLALEDVAPGTGELEYYVGSHRDPDFLFGGAHKWMVEAPHDHARFLASLRIDAKRHGHPKERFLAREGDVLVWHADLAHGGSRIRRRGATRQSLVTHFTPERNAPPYVQTVRGETREQDGSLFISEHAPFR